MTQYTNWKGERKPKCKRGFDTKREAQEWEHTFRQQNSGDLDMPFSAFVEIYCQEQKPRLKESTWQTKENIIQQKILPYFENYKINEITTKDVRAWQNEMLAYRNEENNVDGSRTHLNIDYCNEPIKKIYHELFDDALKRYNEKQTRADRRIENYYEKIRNSKQEKPFHELILQIGDKENMSAESENGQLARQILDEYYRGFQERNDGLENLRNVEEMLDNAPEYQLSEPQSFMSAKAYKTKIAEPLIQKLKALIKTALARCFEGWDSYHRLNITNGNLYRENEMLSKINSKLKSENENLRLEVKDYKLLRKVFGHKQIDELLEQSRNIKGRKRENPRSR